MSELLEGRHCGRCLNYGPLPVRKAIDYATQIAHGLAAAHEKGIVHRDLKPANLFVTKDGSVKILDFGLAKLKLSGENQPDTTQDRVVMGTAGYMSPEQVRGEHVDHRADIFAFGVILYEMLSGKRAFHRSTSAETMTAILNEDPPPIEGKLPAPLKWTIERCLAKEPEQRYESTRDLYRELCNLRDHLSGPIPVRPLTAVTARKIRRRWIPRRRSAPPACCSVECWSICSSLPARISGSIATHHSPATHGTQFGLRMARRSLIRASSMKSPRYFCAT